MICFSCDWNNETVLTKLDRCHLALRTTLFALEHTTSSAHWAHNIFIRGDFLNVHY